LLRRTEELHQELAQWRGSRKRAACWVNEPLV